MAATNAILTLEEAKEHLKEETTDHDEMIDALNDAVLGFIEKDTSRKIAKRNYTGELFNGDGSPVLVLREYPVTAVAKVEFMTGLNIWTTQSLTNLVIDPEINDRILFRDLRFPKGIFNIRNDYTAGIDMTTLEAGDTQLAKQVARELLTLAFTGFDRMKTNIASVTFQGQTVSYIQSAMHKETLLKLDRLRRW